MTTSARTVRTPQNVETLAWKWMRYSGVVLIPLAWFHVALNDVIIGVHAIDTSLVVRRWMSLGWQIYDILLLGFAFAHGMNGLRQVVNDFIHDPRYRRWAAWVIFGLWLVISAIGAIAIIATSRGQLAGLEA